MQTNNHYRSQIYEKNVIQKWLIWNFENIKLRLQSIMIKYWQIDQISALNKPCTVEMPLDKLNETKLRYHWTIITNIRFYTYKIWDLFV